MFNKTPVNPARSAGRGVSPESGYEALAGLLAREWDRKRAGCLRIAVDGTHGAGFSRVRQEIERYFSGLSVPVSVTETGSYLKTGEQLREHFRANITDNRAFGYVTEASIDEYFVSGAQASFSESLSGHSSAGVVLAIGTGAFWLGGGSGAYDVTLFLDVSREKQQVLHKKGLLNFGMSDNEDAVEKYKISFFVEWPILETYRKRHLREFAYYVDMNNEEHPVFVSTEGLLQLVDDISRYPMRVKPFFAPGIWGGQYLKKLADLPQDWVNCAWSFEPIAPENSILIGCGDQVIEVPFLIVMANAHREIMGDRAVSLFGDYFPIRFDYLDTIDGSNLSCQVHPKQKYIRERFNEVLEQQESYYIMEQKGASKVYLGLTETCTEEEFMAAVEKAQETGVPMEFAKYVQEWEAEKGDLFLIPTGTVHCSGKDNLVLEISSTTWWFTFKIYDYVRKDLDGKPRPINIDFAKDNIDYYKKTEWVKDNLIARPRLLDTQGGSSLYELGQRDDLLFYVHRIHLDQSFEDRTGGEFAMLNLVEGERVRIVSTADESVFVEMGYAESYIVPAGFGSYRIENRGSSACKIIKAGVSADWKAGIVHE